MSLPGPVRRSAAPGRLVGQGRVTHRGSEVAFLSGGSSTTPPASSPRPRPPPASAPGTPRPRRLTPSRRWWSGGRQPRTGATDGGISARVAQGWAAVSWPTAPAPRAGCRWRTERCSTTAASCLTRGQAGPATWPDDRAAVPLRVRPGRQQALRRSTTWPTRASPASSTWPTGWASRYWSRPGRHGQDPAGQVGGRDGSGSSACSATRGSTSPRRCTSGTTRSNCCASRPSATKAPPGARSRTTSSPTTSSSPGPCWRRSGRPGRRAADRRGRPGRGRDRGTAAGSLSDYQVCIPSWAPWPPTDPAGVPDVEPLPGAVRGPEAALPVPPRRLRDLDRGARSSSPRCRASPTRWPTRWRIVRSIRQLELKKPPSVSETLDWATLLLLLGVEQVDATTATGTANILLKYQSDIAKAAASSSRTRRWAASRPAPPSPGAMPDTPTPESRRRTSPVRPTGSPRGARRGHHRRPPRRRRSGPEATAAGLTAMATRPSTTGVPAAAAPAGAAGVEAASTRLASVGAGIAADRLLSGFIVELRSAGLPVSLTENLDAMEARPPHPARGLHDTFKYALGATLVKNAAHWRVRDGVRGLLLAAGPRSTPSPTSRPRPWATSTSSWSRWPASRPSRARAGSATR